jgi:hypothetical protein
MKKQAFAALTAAVLGLILVLFLTLVLKVSNNLWVLIGISIFVSGFSALLGIWISSFFPGDKHAWDFGSARDAHEKLASLVPPNTRIKEIIFVAYTANSAYRLMEVFDKKNCKVDRLRMLLRNPISLALGEGKKGSIPNDKTQIENRLSQMRAHLLGDILKKRLGMQQVHQLEVKFFDGDPVLRGMVIDGKKGFFSIYTKRGDPGIIDYSATNSATLRLSTDGGYEEKILTDFLDWFNLVWEYGSKTITEDVLDKML